jgi:predicted metalloprotease with PDZ domain
LGVLRLEKKEDGLRVINSTLIGSPAYVAGLDRDDELVSVAGTRLASPEDLPKALEGHKPGDEVDLVFRSRGNQVQVTVRLAEEPQLLLLPVETTGGTLSKEQQYFRDAWLHSKVGN